MKKGLLLYKCKTPLHAGEGNDLGVVDMPIQREKHTNFPKMEASGLKGSFLDYFKKAETSEKTEESEKLKDKINSMFGTGNESESEGRAGALIFTDARLLFFPVKSAKGIFAWITCPFVLKRFADEIKGIEDDKVKKMAEELGQLKLEPKDEAAYYFGDVKNNKLIIGQKKVILGDFGMNAIPLKGSLSNEVFNKIYDGFGKKLETHMLIVSDEIFSYFTEMNTQIDTRIRIGENGVVENGGLFTQEFLPEESILYSTVSSWKKEEEEKKEEEDDMTMFKDKIGKGRFLTFGGSITIGKGITEVTFII